MTIKQYIESKNLSFAEALKMYDEERDGSLENWLKTEYETWDKKTSIKNMFKPGALIKYGNNSVFQILVLSDDGIEALVYEPYLINHEIEWYSDEIKSDMDKGLMNPALAKYMLNYIKRYGQHAAGQISRLGYKVFEENIMNGAYTFISNPMDVPADAV